MRLPVFRGLRGRLSYANVMATLAFFFALTGGSMAATKYLTTSDRITQGDLAGSTYGNPLIAAGKVTADKIADGAITSSKFDSAATAPNATKLANHPLTDLPLVIYRGTYQLHNGNTILDPDHCFTAGGNAIPGVQAGDIPLAGSTASTSVEAHLAFIGIEGGYSVQLRVCNNTGGTRDVGGDYSFIVIR